MQMQGVYLSYLMGKNHITSAVIECECGLSAASVSRIRSGKLEVPEEEYANILKAAKGSIDAYHIFCDQLNKSPQVITPENKEEAAIALSAMRQFFEDQMAEMEARFAAEIDRLTAAHERELQTIERIHEREIARLEALYAKHLQR